MSDVSDIRNFRGILPAKSCSDLPANFASVAENVDLRRGCLESWRTPVLHAGFARIPGRVHSTGCCWRAHADPCAKFVEAGLCNDLIVSAPGKVPQITLGGCCDGTPCFLGIPRPEPVQIIGGTVTPGAFSYPRSYVITYCRGCDEGMPSSPSNVICLNKEDPVRINLPLPPAGCNITEVHVYRLMPIQDMTGEALQHPEAANNNLQVLLNQNIDSAYFRVATLPIDVAAFIDVGGFKTLDRAMLTSEDNAPPPVGLCVDGETSYGTLVGHEGKSLYFSERNMFHAWPRKYRCQFDRRITDVAVCDNTVFVFTNCQVFMVQDPEDCREMRKPVALKAVLPLCSAHQVVSIPGGILFNSRDGIIQLGLDGSHSRISGPFFTPSDWHSIDPSSLTMAKHEGMLFFTTSKGSWIMDLDLDRAGVDTLNLTTLSYRPSQWLEGPCGELYMIINAQAWQWNHGPSRLRYRWRQAPQNSCDEVRVGAYKVKFAEPARSKGSFMGVHISIENDGGCIDACTIHTDKTQTVKNNTGTDTVLDITGFEHVSSIRYGASRSCVERALQEAVQ